MNSGFMVIFLLGIHIASGFTALFSAFGALFSSKGQARHRQFGRVFFYTMTVVFVTAIPLSIVKNNLFLFLIAIFSYYLAFSGWRYANNRSGLPASIDWITSIIMFVASLFMLGVAIRGFDMGDYKTIMLLVFGVIGAASGLSDLKTYRHHSATGKQRIVKHLGAMLGATIATLTAFSVTNIPLKPQIVLWLGPTILLSPVIIWWKHKILKTEKSAT